MDLIGKQINRARDTKLGRDVAIKILPPAFAIDPDRLRRWSMGAHIYFRGAAEHAGNLRGLSLEDGTERSMTNLVGKRGTIGMMQPETDGRFLYFPDATILEISG